MHMSFIFVNHFILVILLLSIKMVSCMNELDLADYKVLLSRSTHYYQYHVDHRLKSIAGANWIWQCEVCLWNKAYDIIITRFDCKSNHLQRSTTWLKILSCFEYYAQWSLLAKCHQRIKDPREYKSMTYSLIHPPWYMNSCFIFM